MVDVLTGGWWEGEMENVTPLFLSCLAQFSPALLTLPPSSNPHLNFLSLLSLCFFPLLPLLLLLLSPALAPLYRPIMESFLAERALTLPGCLCVELSKYGKEKRGLRFSYWALLGLFAHEYGKEKRRGKCNLYSSLLYSLHERRWQIAAVKVFSYLS